MPAEPVPAQSGRHVFVSNTMTASIPAPNDSCGVCGRRYDDPVHVLVDGTPARSDSRYSAREELARNEAFLQSDGMNARESRLWNEAWHAAREFYAPNADEAERLRERIFRGRSA